MGLERTVEQYLDRQKAVFSEVYRVLRDDATCWVLVDDAISERSYRYAAQSYHHARIKQKVKQQQTNVLTPDTTYLAPPGDWLDIPGRFKQMMQSLGWHWRDTIIWCKGASGRKEATRNRCRHNYEFLLMFSKSRFNYWYDQDPLRIPLAGGQPYSVIRGSQRTRGWEGARKRKDGLAKGYTTPGRHKGGTLRRDGDRDFRVFSNPLGRIHDAVWTIPPTGWKGIHSSSMPEELVRNCLLLTCPPDGTVLDPFGGAGTVSVVAKRLHLKSVYIDRHEPFVQEARERLAGARREDDVAANDNLSAQATAD
jgi:DNA modification methylase